MFEVSGVLKGSLVAEARSDRCVLRFKTEAEVLFRPGSIFKVVASFRCDAVDPASGDALVARYELVPRGKQCPQGLGPIRVLLLDEIGAPVMAALRPPGGENDSEEARGGAAEDGGGRGALLRGD